ncbi:tetratricopeptide repeat protein [Paraburkholderia ribeironis]|uniref:tetratricopeptide repeat protein n=1 Tax=Paraburkholderia ribeironis TaxID=1247936 RepID=UPI0013563BBA|nr:hypothetical protein [Paraburkholderia ribeironis]
MELAAAQTLSTGQSVSASNGSVAVAVNAPNSKVVVEGGLDKRARDRLDAIYQAQIRDERTLTRMRRENQKAIAQFLTSARQASAGPDAKEAARALDAGNPIPSEAVLREEEASALESARADEARSAEHRKQAAELARQRGALIFFKNARSALEAYKRAAQYDPGDIQTRIVIGDLQATLGDTDQAQKTFTEAASIAKAKSAQHPDNPELRHELAVADERTGETLEAQGNPGSAIGLYRQALPLLDSLAQHDVNNVALKTDLAETHARIGGVLTSEGNLAPAIEEFRQSTSIATQLLQSSPDDVTVQLTIAANHLQAGDILSLQNNLPNALAEYRQAQSIAESQARRGEAGASSVQVSIGHHSADGLRLAAHERIGDVLLRQGDLAGARVELDQTLRIEESLAKDDPNNLEWQGGIGTTHVQLGAARFSQGDLDGAIVEFRTAAAIFSSLHEIDPANLTWEGAIGSAHFMISTCQLLKGSRDDARSEVRSAISSLEEVVKRNPNDATWTLLLAQAYSADAALRTPSTLANAAAELTKAVDMLQRQVDRDPSNTAASSQLASVRMLRGEVLMDQQDLAGAIRELRQSSTELESLSKDDPTNSILQLNLSSSLGILAIALKRQGDHAGALDAATRSLSAVDSLAKRDPGNMMAQTELATTCLQLGRLTDAPDQRRALLKRGLSVVEKLKSDNRMPQGMAELIPQFNTELAALSK